VRKNVPFAGTAEPTPAAGGTLDLLQACRMTSVRTNQNRPANGAFFLEAADNRRTASPESVRPDAEEQGDCRNEKDLQMQVFSRAVERIRTHDLLHGKQHPGWRDRMQLACKQAVSRLHDESWDVRDFTPICGGLRTD
jgi:hypothetical protein